ncbi:Hypothetical protein FKW44_010392, partial [Caligus rogercresseyi]
MLPILSSGSSTKDCIQAWGSQSATTTQRSQQPEYPVVSDKLFSSVKKTYTEEVLNSVSDVAAEHLDE